MNAAKVLDTKSRLLGMAGEANDADSRYTQVKMKGASRLLKLPETECFTIWIKLPRYRRPAEWEKVDDPAVDTVYLGCTQRAAAVDKETTRTKTKMSQTIQRQSWKKLPKRELFTTFKRFCIEL